MALCIIGAKDIEIYVKQKDAVLVDLREPQEYENGHISGALNIPAEKLQNFMKRTDRGRIHIFYCQHGSMSFQEGKKYARTGFKICSLAGGLDGYMEWQKFRQKG